MGAETKQTTATAARTSAGVNHTGFVGLFAFGGFWKPLEATLVPFWNHLGMSIAILEAVLGSKALLEQP